MNDIVSLFFDEWFKIYPLLCILLFASAFGAGLRGGVFKVLFTGFVIIFASGCFMLGGFFVGAVQILFLIIGGYYYYGVGIGRKQASSE